jgi:hypothetical protein
MSSLQSHCLPSLSCTRRVVGQPSSKTSYVVLGDNAGPSKLTAIKKHGLQTLSEDEFLSLIATRKGPGGPGGAGFDEKTKKKMAKEQEEIKQAAKDLERREKQASKEAEKSGRSVRTHFTQHIGQSPAVRDPMRRHSCGQRDMRLSRLRKFAATKAMWRSFNNGFTTGRLSVSPSISSTCNLPPQVGQPQMWFQKARQERHEYFPCSDDHWATWYW